MEETKYYRFSVGSVIVRRTGNKIEKRGKRGVWEDAPQLYRRFVLPDSDLTEISEEEALRMMKNRTTFKVYTRNADPGAYPAGLAGSVHFAYTDENGEEIPLNKNYGILFTKGEISAENTIIPMGIQNPQIFDMGDGVTGICAEVIYENGDPVPAYKDHRVLWKTTDLIHFEEAGILPKTDLSGYDLSDTIAIPAGISDKAIRYWTPITCTGVELPEDIRAAYDEDPEHMYVRVNYSDGSKASKRIIWDRGKSSDASLHGAISRQSFSFPLAMGYGDPVIFKWGVKWYFLGTNDNLNDIGIYIREADTVEGLFAEGITEHLILPFDEKRGFEQTFWAPEFHVIGGKPCILFAVSGHTWGPQCHYMRLKDGENPVNEDAWEDPIRVVKKDGTPLTTDGITLDMTYIKALSGSYMVWSYRKDIGTPADTGSMLYIALVNEEEPWKLTGDPVLLSRPLYGWENLEGTINNEGPYALVRDGKVYLAYSGGSANAYTYALGLFTADSTADLCDIASWHKSITPVLTYYSVDGEYGPGHHSFYTNEEGETMIAYHAETDIKEHLRCDGIRRVHFREDNTPYFQMSPEEDLPVSVSMHL